MARFHGPPRPQPGSAVPREHQWTLRERLDELTGRVAGRDPVGPATAIFWCVLSLIALGLLLQVNHAATTQPAETFWAGTWTQLCFRVGAVLALLLGMRLGPQGLRRTIPALTVIALLALVMVYLPYFGASRNGANRWLGIPGTPLSFQPSELARIVMVLWVADRCVRLGEDVRDLWRGVWPMLRLGLLFFALILFETDLGGALLFLACFLVTMWIGGARLRHATGPLLLLGGAAVAIMLTSVSYVRHRLEMWMGTAVNEQVARSTEAIASGDLLGVGLGHGLFRNARVPYLESDYVFALVGEEFGLLGLMLVLTLFLAFLWHALRLTLSIQDRYAALAAFGLLVSVGLQAMVHVQVVSGLAPPKGLPLPFLSHGGTSLIVSSLAVGLALGAARAQASRGAPSPAPSAALSPVRPVVTPAVPATAG